MKNNMNEISGIYRYAVDSDKAEKVYDAVVNSCFYKNYSDSLSLDRRQVLLVGLLGRR